MASAQLVSKDCAPNKAPAHPNPNAEFPNATSARHRRLILCTTCVSSACLGSVFATKTSPLTASQSQQVHVQRQSTSTPSCALSATSTTTTIKASASPARLITSVDCVALAAGASRRGRKLEFPHHEVGVRVNALACGDVHRLHRDLLRRQRLVLEEGFSSAFLLNTLRRHPHSRLLAAGRGG